VCNNNKKPQSEIFLQYIKLEVSKSSKPTLRVTKCFLMCAAYPEDVKVQAWTCILGTMSCVCVTVLCWQHWH